MNDQAEQFNPEWLITITEETFTAETKNTRFTATVGATGAITWVYINLTKHTLEIVGYWNPADNTFLASGSAASNTEEGPPTLFAAAGIASALHAMVEQINDSIGKKTREGIEA